MIWAVILLIAVLAIAGGIAISKLLFLLLVVAAVIALLNTTRAQA